MRFKYLITLLAFAGLSSLRAEAAPRMRFTCTGNNGDTAIQVSVKNYQDGEIRGIHIQRRGLYQAFQDQIVDTDAQFPQHLPYRPRNPEYQGLQKYVVDTEADRSMVKPIYNWETGEKEDNFDYSQYEFMLPPRSELETIWAGVEDPHHRGPGEFNNAHLSMRYSNGDSHTMIRLKCHLGWRN